MATYSPLPILSGTHGTLQQNLYQLECDSLSSVKLISAMHVITSEPNIILRV